MFFFNLTVKKEKRLKDIFQRHLQNGFVTFRINSFRKDIRKKEKKEIKKEKEKEKERKKERNKERNKERMRKINRSKITSYLLQQFISSVFLI